MSSLARSFNNLTEAGQTLTFIMRLACLCPQQAGMSVQNRLMFMRVQGGVLHMGRDDCNTVWTIPRVACSEWHAVQ